MTPITSIATSDNTSSNSLLLSEEYRIILEHALRSGVTLPSSVHLSNDVIDIDVYNTLLSSIAPSTPQSISYIKQNILGNDKVFRWYQVPLLRTCLIITFIALIILISVSLSPEVNAENQAAGILSGSGKVLLINLVFICSSALLGVMFFILKTINQKIKKYTLLPVDIIELNITIVIGVVSGFVVAELFTFSGATLGNEIEMQKMTLALLGGFSSDAIFSILQGIVNKVKLLFSTGAPAQIGNN